MTDTIVLDKTAEVSLREITADTVATICKLSDTLVESQKRMVAPNALSIAQAHFSQHAWFRGSTRRTSRSALSCCTTTRTSRPISSGG